MTSILLALLESMYNVNREVLATGVVPIESFYILVINTLMIVQDATLRPVLCKLTIETDLMWYTEKPIKKVSDCAG